MLSLQLGKALKKHQSTRTPSSQVSISAASIAFLFTYQLVVIKICIGYLKKVTLRAKTWQGQFKHTFCALTAAKTIQGCLYP